jgi:cytidylate kinase
LIQKRRRIQTQKLDSIAWNGIMNMNLKPQLIAIDGPVAVGKSSVGLRLANRLGYIFFDTGMIYRAFTWKVLKSDVSPDDEQKLCQLADTTEFNFTPWKEGTLSVYVDGVNISSKLLCTEIEERVALIAKVVGVRQVMVSQQRKLAERGKVVMAGRDIGTVVLPWAELKIFLTASTEERARRRYQELSKRGENSSLETVLADLKKRDELDINRTISPLKPAEDAIIINTENLSLEQVVDKICTLAVNH